VCLPLSVFLSQSESLSLCLWDMLDVCLCDCRVSHLIFVDPENLNLTCKGGALTGPTRFKRPQEYKERTIWV